MYACFFQFFPLLVVSIVGVDGYSKVSPLDALGNMKNMQTCFIYIVFSIIFGAIVFTPILFMFKQVRLTTLRQLLR
jgi:hypothetical protein